MDILLKTNDLSKKYGDVFVVDKVNMTINKGDIYGLIGENGAGKSTLIRLITKIAIPTSGDYLLNLNKRKGIVSAIVEKPAVHPSFTGLANLELQSSLLGLNKTVEELNELLRLVGLGFEIGSKKKAKDYSLGMKQRLSIALNLLSEPDFMLLDEPMNGLDPLGIKNMRELILNLNKEKGITFLISSHILAELDKVVTKYGFISHGKLVKEISTKDLHLQLGSITFIRFEKEIMQNTLDLFKNYNYEIIDNYNLKVFSDLDQVSLIKETLKEEIKIIDIKKEQVDIEAYYFKTIGGLND